MNLKDLDKSIALCSVIVDRNNEFLTNTCIDGFRGRKNGIIASFGYQQLWEKEEEVIMLYTIYQSRVFTHGYSEANDDPTIIT